MKRREFLKGAGSLTAGSLLPQLAIAQSSPCAPPILSVADGTSTVTSCVSGGSALLFPSNVSGSSRTSAYGVLQFDSPETDGLPITGPGNIGITVIRRINPIQQTGYYAQFWYVPVLNSESAAPINGEEYWGFHPYPVGGSGGTSHNWEIGARGGDAIISLAGATIPVIKGQWYTQALRVQFNGGSPILTFWTNLPNITNASKIESRGSLGIAQSIYRLVIGNSHWMQGFQEERASCHHGEIKIIAKALSEPDIVAETSDMRILATADGQNHIWWGKAGFRNVDDLTCDYGTGRSFIRNDTGNILSLGQAL